MGTLRAVVYTPLLPPPSGQGVWVHYTCPNATVVISDGLTQDVLATSPPTDEYGITEVSMPYIGPDSHYIIHAEHADYNPSNKTGWLGDEQDWKFYLKEKEDMPTDPPSGSQPEPQVSPLIPLLIFIAFILLVLGKLKLK